MTRSLCHNLNLPARLRGGVRSYKNEVEGGRGGPSQVEGEPLFGQDAD